MEISKASTSDSKPEPRWDIDYEVGRQAEIWVSDLRKELQSGTVEVKRDRRTVETGNIYIEYECFRRGKWHPSGIATTAANLWLFVLIESELAVVITTERLKQMARQAYRLGRRVEETDGSHPTKGVLLPVATVIAAMLREAGNGNGKRRGSR